MCSFLECRQIIGILGQGESNGIVYKVGHGVGSLNRLDPQGPVEFRVEINRCSFCRGGHERFQIGIILTS